MRHQVTLIPGDGIGPEISAAMREVVEATGVGIDWHVQQAGAKVMDVGCTESGEARKTRQNDQHATLHSIVITVAEAVEEAALDTGTEAVAMAVHGVLARPQQLLRDGDRVELLRPLLADPKENRRRRARGGD